MAISFPGSKSNGQKFTSGNKSWTWNGSSWKGATSSGGDAVTLGGVSSSNFLRSDASDSHAGTLTLDVVQVGNELRLPSGSSLTDVTLTGTSDQDTGFNWSGSGAVNYVSNGVLKYNLNNVWHTGNDGSGSGLDADTVDGLQASSFLRSDAGGRVQQQAVTNSVTSSNSVLVVEGTESQLQIIAEDSGSWAGNITLTNAPASGNNKHWTMHHTPASHPTISNALQFNYLATNTVGNIGGDGTGASTEAKMTITNDGKVGIGTETPANPLHVHADGIGIRLDGTANTTRRIFFRSTSAANPAEIYADGTLRLWTDDAGTDIKLEPADDVVMNPGGNVNIGGSAGSMKLNVNGDIYLGDNGATTNGLYGGGNIVVSSDNNALIIGDGNTSSPSASNKITIGFGNTDNINYDSLRGASLESLNSPAVVTAEFYTDHAKMLKQLQLLNSASNPSSPKTGAIYYNTTDDVVKVYSGTEWVEVGAPTMNATGGTVTTYTVGGVSYRSHTFTSSGTFTPTTTGTIDVLIVAGGGCGGRDNAGGGGAGGTRVSTNVVVTPSSYTIVVGAGGAANTNDNGGNGGTGFNGGNSSAISITSLGGGFGGSAGTNNPSGQNRTNGGSGGGGAGAESTRSGGSGTAGQGNNGGAGHPSNGGGGGGGGAGAVGGGYSGTNDGGHGGIGIQNNYRTGSNIYYGGGGGAGNNNSVYTAQPGGSGGGGEGGGGGGAGSANTGGGGGGHTHPAVIVSGAGGSGIVVIRYQI